MWCATKGKDETGCTDDWLSFTETHLETCEQ
jgi:hypothetical protein